jgi:hypothetical protein
LPPSSTPQLPTPSTTIADPSEAQTPAMANIPIDPRLFVSHGYQIQKYLTEVSRVGFVSLHSCPFGAGYVQLRKCQ